MTTSRLLLLTAFALTACGGSDKSSDSSAEESPDATTDGGDGDGDTDEEEPAIEPEYPSGSPTGCDLTGTSYQLDFTVARVLQPEALGPVLADAIGSDLAIGISAQTDTTVSTVLALTSDGVQDLCTPSVQPPEGSWADPVFTVGPADVSVDISGTVATLSSFQFTAGAAASCTAIESGVFETDLDARLLGEAIGGTLGSEDPDEMCAVLVTLGAECQPCGSDSEPYCVKLVVDQLSASDRGTPLQVVTETDILDNPDCG